MKLFSKNNSKRSCDSCSDWSREQLVTNPKQLGKLIEDLKEAENQGVFSALNARKEKYETEFSSISATGPLPDIVLCRFKCTSCGKSFELFADTYHGNRKNGWHRK